MTRPVFPIFLAVLLSGCASGPPGTSYPSTNLVLCTKAAPTEAQVVAREANEFLMELGDYLHLQVPPGGLLRIYHYPNRWGLWRHLNREVPPLKWHRGACYETEDAYIVTLSGEPSAKKFQDTLRHELTHYLVAAHFCGIPPWIDEGLSQVMASGTPLPHLEDDLLDRVQREARRSKKPGCLKLLRVPSGGRLNSSQYGTACALTYYLLACSSEAGASRLIRFLESSRPGVPAERTFSASWGISMEEACESLVVWSEDGLGSQTPRGVDSIRPRPRIFQTARPFRIGRFPARASCLVSSIETHGSGRDEAEKKLLLCNRGSSSSKRRGRPSGRAAFLPTLPKSVYIPTIAPVRRTGGRNGSIP